MRSTTALIITIFLLALYHANSKKFPYATQGSREDDGPLSKDSDFIMGSGLNTMDEMDNDANIRRNDISSSERHEKLKILTMEGKPGWISVVQQKEQEAMQKLTKEIAAEHVNVTKASPFQYSSSLSAPTQLFSDVKSKLSGFTSPLATRVKTTVSGLNTKWKKMSKDDRESIVGTMATVADNIVKFGNAGEDPIGAIQGAVNIVGAISTFFGPVGQLVSIGLSFVSGLLGLFGGGPKPKPIDQVVRKQIDEALAKYRDQSLTDKARGLVRAFRGSKAYLDGAAQSGKPLTNEEMIIASSRVPITQGSAFMGELASVIERMLRDNREQDAHKCIKYCELYAQLAGLKDMILTQMISMASPEMQNDINGLMAYQKNYRDATKLLFEPLYTVNYGNKQSKILPYFDPDISVVTDSYATSVLDLGKYDRSMTGLYCLVTIGNVDLTWERKNWYIKSLIGNRPYLTTVKHSNANCYWKLVPHGNNIFSIVNKYKCEQNYDYCGAMLSFDGVKSNFAMVNLDRTDPVLWEINGYYWRRIRSKWGCLGNHYFCNQELRVKMENVIDGRSFPRVIKFPVGQLAPSDGLYYWKLKRKT